MLPLPRSPGGDFSGESHKSSLRTPGSPPPHKDLKVRFAEADQTTEFGGTGGVSASLSAQPPPSFDGYWAAPLDASQVPSSSAAGAAVHHQPGAIAPSPTMQPPQQQYQVPPASYGYYYNPYAYAQYTAMPPNQQGWAPTQPASNFAPAGGGDTVYGAAPPPPNAAACLPQVQQQQHHQQQDPKRMQMLARSVSITVNPPLQQEGGAAAAATTPGAAFVPASVGPSPAHTSRQAERRETEAQEEARLIIWAGKRLRRASLLRSFRSWTQLCEERWWKTQVALRDQQTQLLAAQIRHLESRPVRYIRRYKMKQVLQAWVSYHEKRNRKAMAVQRANVHAARALVIRAFATWTAAASERREEAVIERRADVLYRNRKRRFIVSVWRSLVGRRALKGALIKGAEETRARWVLRNALGSWAYLARFYSTKKAAVQRNKKVKIISVFLAWQERIWVKKKQAAQIQKFRAQHALSARQWAFFSWLAYADGRHARREHDVHAQSNVEVERLRQENERLARVVDSGDWGRDRVSELTQAGHVLQQERDALLQLVESLPGNRTRLGRRLSVQTTANGGGGGGGSVAASRRQSTVQPTRTSTTGTYLNIVGSSLAIPFGAARRGSGVVAAAQTLPPPPPTTSTTATSSSSKGPKPAPLPANLRAKMTVRAGSSFNALVRALKQDLISSGALTRVPGAAFAVDKVSSQHVAVTAEGGVKIEAVGNTASPGFSFGKADMAPKEKRAATGEESVADIAAAAVERASVTQPGFGGRSVAFGKRLENASDFDTS